ncbi:hypothetical protein GCM10017687_49540 [Streptomyces echinatus]
MSGRTPYATDVALPAHEIVASLDDSVLHESVLERQPSDRSREVAVGDGLGECDEID